MDYSSRECARAFNLGCDARIAGQNRKTNPYILESILRLEWNRGYSDVSTYWGDYAMWDFKLLPEVEDDEDRNI